MGLLLPRAEFVQAVPGRKWLYAVYNQGVRLADVEPVVYQMKTIPGVRARAIKGSLDDANGPIFTLVELKFPRAVDMIPTMRLLKRLAKPKLPVAVRALRVGLVFCQCDRASSALDRLVFIQGLGPEDTGKFILRYFAGMEKLPMAALLGNAPLPPYPGLMGAIENLLATLGAKATQIEIQTRLSSQPCTHPK